MLIADIVEAMDRVEEARREVAECERSLAYGGSDSTVHHKDQNLQRAMEFLTDILEEEIL